MARPLPELPNACLGAVVCLLFAVATGWLTFDDVSRHHRLATDGEPSTAQVIDRATVRYRRNPDEYWLRVRTEPPWADSPAPFTSEGRHGFRNDTPPPGERDIEVAYWEYAAATPGGRLKVLYLPDVASRPIPTSVLSGWRPPYVGFLLTIAFLAGAIVFARDGRRSRRA